MAKKTTKTTVKHTKKGTVTKTVTKKSKKGLIIGIVVGALALAGAGVGGYFLWKHFNEGGGSDDVKFSVKESTFTLDDSMTKAEGELDWTPSSHSIECSDFTFELKKQTSITATVTAGKVGSRPLNLTVTFDKALKNEDEGELKFKYNDKTAKKEGEGKVKGIKVELYTPEPEAKATFSVSPTDYVTLTYEDQENVTTIDISNKIGSNSIEMTFAPKEGYEDKKFEFSLNSEEFKITPKENIIVIEGNNDRKFQDGDNLIATVTPIETKLPCFALENVADTGGDITLTLTKYSGTEGTTYSADVDYVFESDITGDTIPWVNWDYNTNNSITITNGDTVYFKGNNPNGFNKREDNSTEVLTFGASGYFEYIKAHGNIMSLIDDGACNTLEIPNTYCFSGLFNGCNCLNLGEDFILPATTLKEYCYYSMFHQCNSITYAPNLPATTAPSGCYNSMYFGCEHLETTPVIKATTINNHSGYQDGGQQFSYMFASTGITEIPDLSKIVNFTGHEPRSTFASMFYSCDSLTKVEKDDFPVRTNLYSMEFDWMFRECENLESVDISSVTYNYVQEINSRYAFRQMFEGCSNLSYIKVGFGTPGEDTWPTYNDGWTTEEITGDWLKAMGDVPMQTSGTFVWKGKAIQPGETASWERGKDRVLEGWTIETYE